MKRKRVTHKVAAFLAIAFLVSGCIKTFRMNPQFYERVQSVRNVGLIPPSIKVYQISAGGVPELMDEWSTTAQENVSKAVEELFSDRDDYAVKPLSQNRIIEEELKDIQALYEAVSMSVRAHTYPGNPNQTFPEKVKNFDYTLGPAVGSLAGSTDLNAVFFVSGFDQVPTAGQQAMVGFGIILSAFLGVNVGPPLGITLLECAMVDLTTGDILWYNIQSVPGTYDLRNPSSARRFVKILLSDLPGPRKTEATEQ